MERAGSVPRTYQIGTYEVTNAQYVEFLNAKAAISDPYGLWSGGVIRTGVAGAYQYRAPTGAENNPAAYVSFYEMIRFANWMNNGQGAGDTETGSYTLLGGTAIPSNGATMTRNPGATIMLSSEDEWYRPPTTVR